MKKSERRRLVLPVVADVYELAGALRDHGERIARTVGQTQARWQVMSAASAEPKTVPQIARRLGVTRQGVQRLADLLVREGAAIYQANPDHRGSPHLILTQRGRSALATLSSAADAYHASVAGSLSGADLQSIHDGLKRLIRAVEHAAPLSQSPNEEE